MTGLHLLHYSSHLLAATLQFGRVRLVASAVSRSRREDSYTRRTDRAEMCASGEEWPQTDSPLLVVGRGVPA